jgi:hypothetical protein
MAAEKRGVLNIKTMAGLVDGRRIRTSAGALLEMSMIEMEKQRLKKEMLRAELRSAEIRARLAELEVKQHRLQLFVERPNIDIQYNIPVFGAASPLPIHTAPTDRMKRRQLSY